MPKTSQRLQVFVGSPSDVAAERRIALEVIDQLGRDPLTRGWGVDPVAWDVTPYARTTWLSPQKAIDRGLPRPSGCDICVFILRHRIGTVLPSDTFPPPDDGLDFLDGVPLTGSVWEFRDAMASAIASGTKSGTASDPASDPAPGHPRVLTFKGDAPLHVPKQRGPERDEVLRQSDAVEDLFARARDDKGSLRWDVIDFDSEQKFRAELDKVLRANVSVLIETGGTKSGGSRAKGATLPPIPRAYLDWLQRMAGHINLLGLDPKEDRNVGLGDIYVPALTRDRRALEAVGSTSTQPRLIPLLARLGKDSLYAPGAAGSGKSTFCKWACWVTAIGFVPSHPDEAPEDYRESLPDSLRGRLPILCGLRQFEPLLQLGLGQDSMFRAQLETALMRWVDEVRPGDLDSPLMQRYLDAGRLLLVLDGFDEVPSSRAVGSGRAYPHAALLRGLADALPFWRAAGNRILLTARPYGLSDRERRDLDLEEDRLEALPSALSELFITRWFRATHPERREEYLAGLQEQLADNPLPEEILANPLMLTGLCVKFGEGQRLPKDVYELFDTLVSQVLHRRFLDKTQEVEPVRKRLAAVALAMHTGRAAGIPRSGTASTGVDKSAALLDVRAPIRTEPAPEVSIDEVDVVLKAYADAQPYTEGADRDAATKREELLSRSGLLLPREEDRAGFYHLYFQDFLTAERLFQTDADVDDYLVRFAAVPQWHQCFLFLFAMLASRRSLEVAFEKFHPLRARLGTLVLPQEAWPAILLGRCLELAYARGARLGDWGEDFRDACLRALHTLQEPPLRARLFESLGRTGLDNRRGVGLNSSRLPDIDWVHIPAGRVTLEDNGGTHEVKAFQMARYPITWLQFQVFAEAEDGYCDPRWWQGMPDEARADAPNKATWPIANHPREIVSWYETTAFCRWLTARLGYTVRPPSEAEWQQAATGGDAANEYPWGSKFISDRANCNETLGRQGPHDIHRTTPVGLYATGASLQGVLDLSGNVCEWVADRYHVGRADVQTNGSASEDENNGARVVRGGSWNDVPAGVRAAFRNWSHAGDRSSALGFRLARAL